jgi:TPR repeat protein
MQASSYKYPNEGLELISFNKNSEKIRIKINKIIDERKNVKENKFLNAYVPFVLYGSNEYSKPEKGYNSVTVNQWNFDIYKDLEKSISKSLVSSKLFEVVEKDYDYELNVTLKDFTYKGTNYTYGLSIYGPAVSFLGLPSGKSENNVSAEFKLINKHSKIPEVSIEKIYTSSSKTIHGIYYNRGEDFDGFSIAFQNIMNNFIIDVNKNYDAIYSPVAVANMKKQEEEDKKLIKVSKEQAKKGNYIAQIILGQSYLEGSSGLKMDESKGVYWLRKAMKDKNSLASYKLIIHYYHKGNYREVISLMKETMDWDSFGGKLALGPSYYKGFDFKEVQMTARDLSNKGYPEASYFLSNMYLENYRNQDDKNSNLKYKYISALEKASSQGYVDAMHNLAGLYSEGIIVSQDYDKAVYWFEKAISKGSSLASYGLAYLYQNGKVSGKSAKDSLPLYEVAAKGGVADAQFRLGLLYYLGDKGVLKDYRRAFKWLEVSAKQGDERAQTVLSEIYFEGKSVKKDYLQSYIWASVASANGESLNKILISKLEGIMTEKEILEAQEKSKEYYKKYKNKD